MYTSMACNFWFVISEKNKCLVYSFIDFSRCLQVLRLVSGLQIVGYFVGSYFIRTLSMEANYWERTGSISAFRCDETSCSTWARLYQQPERV